MGRFILRGIMGFFAGFALVSSARAQVVDYTWIVGDGNFNDAANWEGGVVPANDGLARLNFSQSYGFQTVTLPGGTLTLNSLYLYPSSYPGAFYRFDSATPTTLTFAPTAGSYGQTSTNTGYDRQVHFGANVTVDFATDQYWTANSLTFDGAVGGAGRFRFLPLYYYSNYYFNTGTLTLNGPGNFTGGFETSNVNLYLNHVDAVDGGPLFLTDTRIMAAPGYVLDNDITASGRFETGGVGVLNLTGPLTIAGNIDMSGLFNITGDIGEVDPGASLGVLNGTVHLSGTNTYTGGTFLGGPATVIFENSDSVPTTGTISSTTDGYAGVTFTTGVQAGFIDRLSSEGFQGTIGFDSLGATQTFTEDIDLGSLYSALGLGSSTSAILTGTITTPGSGSFDYRFGTGGGTLTVASNLTLPVGLAVTNFQYLTPTTVVLQGNNTFSGDGAWVYGGILIFDGVNALPVALPVYLRDTEGGWDFAYAGITENSGLTPNEFLEQLDLQAPQAVLGLDSADPNAPRTVSDNIDLTPGLAERDGAPFFLGTATAVTLTGELTSGPAPLGLTGVKGGELTVDSVLTNTDIPSLTVGLDGVTGPITGTVQLDGANTYTGGTLWQSGNLTLGNDSALGSGELTFGMSNNDSVLDYTGDLTLANNIRLNSYSAFLGNAGSTADLTLTGAISGGNFSGFEYVGGGTLTFAGTSSAMGWLTIDAAPGGDVVYARANGLSARTNLESGSLTIAADTAVKFFESSVGTTTVVNSGATLSMVENGYGEGPVFHEVAGNITGAGSVRVFGNGAALLGDNSYSGGTTLNEGEIGFTQAGALGTGALTVGPGGGGLTALAQGVTLANTINLQGDLWMYADDYFGYQQFNPESAHDLTLAGVISGPGALGKDSANALTLSGDNTFAGGIMIQDGSVVLAHDHAAGTGVLEFTGYATGGTATFTTSTPVIGGLKAEGGNNANVVLAASSTLTINQPLDTIFIGAISGSGARVNKTGLGYLSLTGSQVYSYTGGTTIAGGGIIFDNDSLIDTHAAGGILVGPGAYAGLSSTTVRTWADFVAKIDLTSTGTLGVDGGRTLSELVDLSGFLPALRLGSASFGTLDSGADIIPNGDYRFGGGGGTLELKSTLFDFNRGLDLTSPADQPLTLWLRNNNYFGGPMTVTHSAAIFGPHSIDYVGNIVIGTGGYVGSADPSLEPADFLAKIAPGTSTGMVGFDDFTFDGRVVGGPVDLSAFGDGIFLGTATKAILRGPIVLPGGATTYRFAGYKGGTLFVETNLGGANSVVIGDLASYGTMRDPHNEGSYSTVVLAGINSYTGGTTLNAGVLVAGPQSLGTGTVTVQPNTFPATEYPSNMLPRLELTRLGGVFANNVTLNGSLWLGGGTQSLMTGVISGAGGIYVDRWDYLPLVLAGANTYTGGTVIANGNLGIGHDAALGTGTVTMQHNGALVTFGGDRTLANDFEVTTAPNDLQLGLRVGGRYDLTLNGSVAFAPGVASIETANPFPVVPLLRLNGGLSGDTLLIFNTDGMVWLAGTNTYTGGTQVDSGALIFNSVASIPAVGQLTDYASYIGLATPTAGLQTEYIDRFSPGYGRVIGFDSPNVASPQTFAANIDLSGMDHPYLSSATAANLTGLITPSDNYYRFAATGDGVLTVSSSLSGNHNLAVDYNERPFLLRLAGTNTYTGNTNVNGAGLIFATAGSLPTGSANLVANSSTGSYFGYEDPAITVADFLSHFDTSLTHAVIGFDSVDVNSPRTITSPDVSVFTYSNEIYLGTATRAIIDGTITWPAYNYGFKFAAYRTGWLTVNAVLAGGEFAVIGSDRQSWTLREVDGAYPTVELAGDNTFSGGTDFLGGQLVLSHANALGTGDLYVENASSTSEEVHRLVLNTPATLNNNINLADANVDLQLATTQAAVTIAGTITGTGSLTKAGANTITLAAANSFSGNITIEGGTLEFAHASASGDVANALRFADAGGTARFTSGNPVIGRLESDDLSSATVEIDSAVNLTVGVHDSGGSYDVAEYHGTITGTGGLTKDGYNTLALSGTNTYTGGTTITQGQILANNTSALGTGAITLNGGELALGRGITVANPISFGGAGGKLSGSTTFTGAVVLGPQGGLSPGNSPGTMTFASDLTLAGSSYLDFEIQDPTGLAGTGYDTLVVGGTLFITSTSADPFVINLLSLTGGGSNGTLVLSDPDATYSLLVASAGSISGFAADSFTLNTAGFTTNFGSDFQFNLFQSGNELRLDFTAVPEPSTYALLGFGALVLGFVRRRRAR